VRGARGVRVRVVRVAGPDDDVGAAVDHLGGEAVVVVAVRVVRDEPGGGGVVEGHRGDQAHLLADGLGLFADREQAVTGGGLAEHTVVGFDAGAEGGARGGGVGGAGGDPAEVAPRGFGRVRRAAVGREVRLADLHGVGVVDLARGPLHRLGGPGRGVDGDLLVALAGLEDAGGVELVVPTTVRDEHDDVLRDGHVPRGGGGQCRSQGEGAAGHRSHGDQSFGVSQHSGSHFSAFSCVFAMQPIASPKVGTVDNAVGRR
jgi:hypothetical protein